MRFFRCACCEQTVEVQARDAHECNAAAMTADLHGLPRMLGWRCERDAARRAFEYSRDGVHVTLRDLDIEMLGPGQALLTALTKYILALVPAEKRAKPYRTVCPNYVSAGDTPYASGDTGCFNCGQSRSAHHR